MNKATWRKGTAIRTGYWQYTRHNNTFYIYLDKPVAFNGGSARNLTLIGRDTPEWGGWVMERP